MMRRVGLLLLLLLTMAVPASAQLALPYTTFRPQSTISSAVFTTNFTSISDKALNRYAPVLKGALAVDTDDAYDLGAVALRFQDGYFSGALTAASVTVTSVTLTNLSCTGCVGTTQIATDGVGSDEIATGAVSASELASTTVAAGTYGNGTSSLVGSLTVDADGRLTSVAQATGFVRSDTATTITGEITFTAFPILSGTSSQLRVYESDQAGNERWWVQLLEAKTWSLRTYNDAFSSSVAAIEITRGTGTAIDAITLAATDITLSGTVYTGALEVNGDVRPESDGLFDIGGVGARWHEIFLDVAPNYPSDRRLKQDIAPVEFGLTFLDALKPVSYRLVKSPTQQHLGFIAQDLVALGFPGVDTRNPNQLALNYDAFLAPLVKGVQELHAEHRELEGLVLKQQIQIGLLTARLKTLELQAGPSRRAE